MPGLAQVLTILVCIPRALTAPAHHHRPSCRLQGDSSDTARLGGDAIVMDYCRIGKSMPINRGHAKHTTGSINFFCVVVPERIGDQVLCCCTQCSKFELTMTARYYERSSYTCSPLRNPHDTTSHSNTMNSREMIGVCEDDSLENWISNARNNHAPPK